MIFSPVIHVDGSENLRSPVEVGSLCPFFIGFHRYQVVSRISEPSTVAPENGCAWKTILSFWGLANFQVRALSFRESTKDKR